MAPARRKAGVKPNINVPVPILDTDGNGYDEWKCDVLYKVLFLNINGKKSEI